MKTTKWLAAAILFLATIIIVTVGSAYLRPPWVQVLGDSVLRTNAPPQLVADAENTVLDRHRNIIADADGKRYDPSSSESAHSWATGPAPGYKTMEVIRGKAQLTDKEGHVLSFERLQTTREPTLVFIEFDGPLGAKSIISELLTELEKRGVTVR